MRTILHLGIIVSLLAGDAWLSAEENDRKQILIAVSKDADPAVKKAALSLKDAPLFDVLEKVGAARSKTPAQIDGEKLLEDKAFSQAAYNHLVLVGLPDQDALLKKCRGHQIGLHPGAVNVRGYGNWKGDIGTVECDWNPFLYSHKVKNNEFTTLCIKISGTSAKGVEKAVEAFKSGLLNGIVPAGEVEPVEESILDMKPDFVAPPDFPDRVGPFFRAGWTQPSAMEYRAYIDLAGFEPRRLWRVKYLKPNVFEDVSAKAWVNGLHRLAYGNAVTLVEFASEEEASKTLEGLGKSRGAQSESIDGLSCVLFAQDTDHVMETSYGEIRYLASGKYLAAVSLPKENARWILAVFARHPGHLDFRNAPGAWREPVEAPVEIR